MSVTITYSSEISNNLSACFMYVTLLYEKKIKYMKDEKKDIMVCSALNGLGHHTGTGGARGSINNALDTEQSDH
jgi:hypothetical protein